MKHSIRRAAALFMTLAAGTMVQAEPAISKYNVVWNSPSKDYNGTMPIGNGDLAANVWVEPTGNLIFYISKSDAWSGGGKNGPSLLKLGRVRVKLDPPLYTEGTTFKQELDLAAGRILIEAASDLPPPQAYGATCRSPTSGLRRISFWIDANQPVINVEIDSSEPCNAEVALESWRAEGKWLRHGAQKDVILPTDGTTVRWYQRNVHSVMDDTLKVQRLEHLMGKFPDPIMDLTFGGLMAGEGLKAKDDRTLVTETPTQHIHLRVHALTEQTETAEAWLTQLEQQRKTVDTSPMEDAWSAHLAWWKAFWDRSTIQLTGTKDAETVARAYHLQRWIQAGAGRGKYPIKFNGSLFTVDGLDARWAKPEGIYSGPDYRRWEGQYWWQNTRLIYWPMLYSGDYEMMLPLFTMYLEMLPLLKERTKHYFGHDGVFFVETSQIWGMQRNQDFGYNNKTFTSFCPYTRWEWQSGLELSAMMLDYYQHTLDDAFVKDVLLPIADEVVVFYDQHCPRDRRANGTMVITPAQALETWFLAIDPMPEVAGLHAVIDGLLALPENLTSNEQRKRWARLNGELPEIPTEVKDDKKCLAPAGLYSQRRNGETPELYAVYPYRAHMVGKPDLDVAIEAFKRRNTIVGGWSQESVNAAMLGLTAEAKRMVIESATAKNWGGKADHPQCRFPAFWGPNADWIPDQDHGSVFITALQRMLMLTDGDTINLMPAWPDDWDATFKLHAPRKTVVEGRVENGRLFDLKVTPESRRKDVVIMGKGEGRADAAEENGASSLMTATLKNYVEQFNAVDEEEGVNTIHNKDVFEFLADNIPLFECPDEDLQRTYYYRWWTYRKHLRDTEDGWVVTEFYPDVSWAKKHNTINCPLGHQIYEGRWLRDPKFIKEYIAFHFGEGGNPGGESKHYSNWLTDAVYAHYMVTGDKRFATDLLDDLIANHRAYSKDGKDGWAKSRFFEDIGLYWQIDSFDGSEVSISGTGVRPSINSYLYGGAVAIANIADLAGKAEVAKAYRKEAEVLKETMQEKLWDADAEFFKTMRDDRAKGNYNNTRIEDCDSGKLVKVRELYGYAPWYFNMPDGGKGYEVAWAQLADPQGFKGKFGPGFAERRHPNFSMRGGWGGCSWPLATSQTLTALANVLNNYDQDVIGKQEYFDTLQGYTRSHVWRQSDGVVVPWIDEAVNQDTGRWISHWTYPKTSGRYYNHSSYCDLIITGLVGLRPRADDTVEVNPLLPADTWDYFCLDNVLYHGRILTIIWDKTGEKYGRGQGLTIFSDGEKIAGSPALSRIAGKLE